MRYLVVIVLSVFFSAPALAVCTSPAGNTGEIIYNSTYNVVQYCNGTNWINTGVADNTATGTGCTGPTSSEGGMIYNSTQGVVQFCNGDDWMDTSCAATAATGGGGCTGPIGVEGQIIYETNNNRLQFCDSTNWVNMGTWCAPLGAVDVADVFSTDLYTGNSGTQTITNGINLTGSGGLVWVKNRSATIKHWLFDSETNGHLIANATDSLYTANIDTSFNSNGFDNYYLSGNVNLNSNNYVAWTFREAPKFFDVVTWTGDGLANRQISHNLGIEPGMIIIKETSSSSDWLVYHKGTGNNQFLNLNNNNAESGNRGWMEYTDPTSTAFTTAANGNGNNDTGESYVAYVFADDPDPDGVIQCGSYVGDGTTSGNLVSLPWSPQFVMTKRIDSTGDWAIFDDQRVGGGAYLRPNLINSEGADMGISFQSNGFELGSSDTRLNEVGATYIYCAIRAEGS